MVQRESLWVDEVKGLMSDDEMCRFRNGSTKGPILKKKLRKLEKWRSSVQKTPLLVSSWWVP